MKRASRQKMAHRHTRCDTFGPACPSPWQKLGPVKKTKTCVRKNVCIYAPIYIQSCGHLCIVHACSKQVSGWPASMPQPTTQHGGTNCMHQTTHRALLVFTLGYVHPQTLHRLAVRGDPALLPLRGTLTRVSKQQQALLLLPQGGLHTWEGKGGRKCVKRGKSRTSPTD